MRVDSPRIEDAPDSVRRFAWWLRRRHVVLPVLAAPLVLAIAVAVASGAPAPPFALAALLLVVAARFLVFGRAEGISMWPTCGTRAWGVVIPAPARRGDLVLLVPDGYRPMVKRVVALAGDEVRQEVGEVRVGGRPVAALGSALAVDTVQLEAGTEQVVPDGQVFVLGDHVASFDSRSFGPVPRDCVVGRFVVLWRDGRPEERTPPAEDEADVALVLASDTWAAPRLRALLATPGWRLDDLSIVLAWGLGDLGRNEALEALFVRSARRADHEGVRRMWEVRLATLRVDRGDTDGALAVLDPALLARAEPHETYAILGRSLRATLCSRAGRWTEALHAAEGVAQYLPPGAFVPPRFTALVGLGRLDEARALLAAGGFRNAWDEPWYRAYLLAAHGDVEGAVDAVLAALGAGFDDAALLATAPLLAPARACPRWVEVGRAAGGRS